MPYETIEFTVTSNLGDNHYTYKNTQLSGLRMKICEIRADANFGVIDVIINNSPIITCVFQTKSNITPEYIHTPISNIMFPSLDEVQLFWQSSTHVTQSYKIEIILEVL